MGSIPRREFLCAIGFKARSMEKEHAVQIHPSWYLECAIRGIPYGVSKFNACQRINGRPTVRFEVISVVKKSGHSNDMMEGSGLEKSST